MVNFFNPWHKSHVAMNQQTSHITNHRSTQKSFIREDNGDEYFQNNGQKEKICRVEGWCSWIKYTCLKNFSNKWTECILKIGDLSEKILIPREKKTFFYNQLMDESRMFLIDHVEDLDHIENECLTLYQEKQGKEFFHKDFHIFRARGVFSWIKYAILKLCSSEWKEVHLKIQGISEKILVKKKDEDLISRLNVDKSKIICPRYHLI